MSARGAASSAAEPELAAALETVRRGAPHYRRTRQTSIGTSCIALKTMNSVYVKCLVEHADLSLKRPRHDSVGSSARVPLLNRRGRITEVSRSGFRRRTVYPTP